MAFPSGTPSYAGFTGSHTLSTDNHAAQSNAEQADIIALANKVGTGASTPITQRLLRGTGVGTSSWSQADLTTDVTGVLPIANGGTGTTNITGTGSAVFGTSPTIATPNISNPSISGGGTWSGSPSLSTPTIADFTNANHSHTNTAGGGTLNAANALQSGSVNYANLLSSIFSSQVQTQVNAGGGGGNLFWMNLGGVKLMWGVSSSQTVNTNKDFVFTLPAFFTTITVCFPGPLVTGGSNVVYDFLAALSTTSIDVQLQSTTNITCQAQFFAIGT